jgi:hypothetical protein
MMTKHLLILLLVVGVTLARPQYVDPGLAVSTTFCFLEIRLFYPFTVSFYPQIASNVLGAVTNGLRQNFPFNPAVEIAAGVTDTVGKSLGVASTVLG